MAKALKIVSVVVGVAALAVVTGGAALGLGLSLSVSAFGVSAGALLTASAVLGAGASLLSPRPKAPSTSASNADRLQVSVDLRAGRKMIFGQTAMATDLRDQEWSGNQTYLDRFVVVASHRVNAIQQIWFDDQQAWTAAGGVTAAYAKYLTVTPVLEGSAANAINIGPRMGSSRRFTGCAYVHFRYRLTGINSKATSPFASSIPTRVTIIGEGASVYDPRRDGTVDGGSGPMRPDDQTTWAWDEQASRNPALCMLWYLLGWRIQNPATGMWKLAVGKGVPAARIDLASFITAANLCDEPVAVPTGGTEPRYRCDGIFSENDDTGLVLDNFKAAMNAVLDDVDGKLRITVLHNDLAVPIGRLTAADVLGEFTWTQTAALNDSVNVIRGGFTDPSAASLYQLRDAPEVGIDSPDGIERAQTVNLPIVQSMWQWLRLARMRLQRSLYGGTFTAVFQASAWKYQKGDVVAFDFYPLGFGGKLFRIADMAIQVDGTVPMMLREEHPAIYAAFSDATAEVQAAEPTTYDPSLLPLVQGIVDAAQTAEWPRIDDPLGTKPENNATNSANPASAFGPELTIGEALAQATETLALANETRAAAEALLSAAVTQTLAMDRERARTARRAFIDGAAIGAVVRNEVTKSDDLIETVDLIGVKTANASAFIINADTVRFSPDESFAQRFSSISAAQGRSEAALDTLTTAVATETSARVTQYTGLTARVGSNESNVSILYSSLANETSARSMAVSNLTATVNGVQSNLNASVYQLQQADANETSARAMAVSALNAKVEGNQSATSASISSLQQADANETSARATAITNLTAKVDGNQVNTNASIVTLQQTYANETEARASAISNVNSRVDSLNGFTTSQIDYVKLSLSYEGTARSVADLNLDARVTTVDNGLTTVSANVNSFQSALASETVARADLSTFVNAQFGSQSASISYLNSVVLTPSGGANATALLQLDVNGQVAGLKATNNGQTSSLTFVFGAYNFLTPDGSSLITASNGKVRMPNVEIDTLKPGAIDFDFINKQNIGDPNGGYQMLPGGTVMMWGRYRGGINDEGTLSVVFPMAFPNFCAAFVPVPNIGAANSNKDLWLQTVGDPSQSGATVYAQAATKNNQSITGFDWIAFGR